ncbi:PilX N-terminal domain-containing pilus assembly protein [Variovorax guangxiensis]|uniref:pilus assembly PilX family protein n=1 Tax=Variovorax guangxiensis TaxID=1775474 RepID=UPI002856499A|nr:PilX N-terminal domain-containing pilus assembly protein [Variovorax guangxiensis]MDR6855435.1 type IV pilus assembly protein PilX [Variovorax guangxiensis]
MKLDIATARSASGERGIVLIMALILLIMISLIATVAIRRATTGEQVSKSLRTQTVAFQAAETALRFCEDQIIRNSKVQSGTRPALEPADYPEDRRSSPSLWKTRANWELSTGKAVAIDTAVVNSTDAAARTLKEAVLPRCMVERLWLPSEDGAEVEAFLITSVGYSPDYRTNAKGTPDSGSEVWLQSTITRR